MESYFDVMAQHPNCLLAVDATDGGKWKSNFKTGYVMPTAPTGSGSFEETHGLLAKTNVEAENDYFKYTTNAIGYIETPLDLREHSGDFTMMAKALVTKNEVAGTVRKDAFLMQGNLNYSNGSFVFFILQAPNASRYELNFYVQNSSNTQIYNTYTLPADFVWTIPHVFSVNYVATTKTFSLFVDGEVVLTSTKSTFDSFYNGTAEKTQIAFKGGTLATDVVKLYNAMIFDKALSADEIKILSDSMTMKQKQAERYVPFITPKNLTANDSDSEWKIFAVHSINSVEGADPNSAEAWKAAAGLTSEVGWMTDVPTGSNIWNVVLGWRRKDEKKFVVTKVILGLYSTPPNEYGYYNWSAYRTNRPEADYVVYSEDDSAPFGSVVPWVSQTTYDEQTFESEIEIVPDNYDELSSKAFYLHFNYDVDPSEPDLKNLGLNLLQLEGYVVNELETDLLCTTPTDLTSNTSNADWECYTQSLNPNSDGNTANAYLAASGSTTQGTRWKNTYAEGSAGVRFVWKRTDLEAWAVKQVKIGNTITSVMPQQIKSFTLQGSNDGSTWSDVGALQTQSQPTMNTYTENTFSYADNTSKYKYWGILCNNVNYPEVAVSSTVAAANLIQFTNEI